MRPDRDRGWSARNTWAHSAAAGIRVIVPDGLPLVRRIKPADQMLVQPLAPDHDVPGSVEPIFDGGVAGERHQGCRAGD